MVITSAQTRTAVLSALLALVVVGLAGCPLPLHTPPPQGAPAATVKFRLGHHYVPRRTFFSSGSLFHKKRLKSLLAIDERELVYQPISGVASTWTRVKPGWRQYRISSHWVEAYYATVRESYYETKYGMCNKNVCGYSMGKYKCEYKYVSCNKQVQKWRNVQRLRHRNLARCSALRMVHMRPGVTYLLSYRYVGPGACSLTCHLQQFKPGGSFRLSPCPNVR